MAAGTGWLIVQRNLTGSVNVAGTPHVWLTAVFSTPSRHIVGMHAAATAADSLRETVRVAVRKPARGAPRGRPTVVLAPLELAAIVRVVLNESGLTAGVDEVVPPDWAEDLLDELAAHLAGRPQVLPRPTSEEWALLYQQTATYAQAAPWERRADDVHLQLELRIGSRRADHVAIVTGNAGISRGLVLCPGRAVPPSLLRDEPETPSPEGTSHLALVSGGEAPPVLRQRARRYGWSEQLSEIPFFATVGPEGMQEIGGEQAEAMTIALAATVEHDRQAAGFGIEVAGEITLAGGHRGRYLAQLETNVPMPIPPGVRLFSGAVRFDWLPRNVFVGLGGLPWAALTTVRERSVLRLGPPQARPSAGDRLPVLILGMGATHGKRVARLLHDARPEGVALVEDRDGVLVMVISASGLYGVSRFDASAADAVARFRRGVETTGGWHAILVSNSEWSANRSGLRLLRMRAVIAAERREQARTAAT